MSPTVSAPDQWFYFSNAKLSRIDEENKINLQSGEQTY